MIKINPGRPIHTLWTVNGVPVKIPLGKNPKRSPQKLLRPLEVFLCGIIDGPQCIYLVKIARIVIIAKQDLLNRKWFLELFSFGVCR